MAFDGKESNGSAPIINGNNVRIVPSQKESQAELGNVEIREYRRRWLVIIVFITYAAANNGQWVQYSVISNIIAKYYDVELWIVNWTSIIFMLIYVPLIFPCSYLMDRIGLRWTVLLGSVVTMVGSWVKVVSVSPDKFYLTFIGQTIAASAQVFVLSAPGRIAANWFNAKQVSTATSIGIFGCQLGVAGTFFITPLIVRNHDKVEDIGADLYLFFWGFAIFSTVSTALVVIFLKEEPPLPPSEARALQKIQNEEHKESFIAELKILLTNRSYLALCNSFGIMIGVLNAFTTLLNQMYLLHFENGEAEAGQIGLAVIITGMFGAITFGMILDKTHRFKETITSVYILTTTGQIMFALALWLGIKWMVYVSAIIFGFFMSGYFSLGYEVCAEFTYPINEGTSTGILNVTNQVYGIILIVILDRVIETFGDFWAHLAISAVLVLGSIITIFTKDLQKRQAAKKNVRYVELPLKEVIPDT